MNKRETAVLVLTGRVMEARVTDSNTSIPTSIASD